MTEYYENGPEGMPRVERMTRSTIMAVLSQKDVPTIYVSREEDYNSLCKFAHAVAEETLARVPAWPVESTTAPVSALSDSDIFSIACRTKFWEAPGGLAFKQMGDIVSFARALLAAAPAPIQKDPTLIAYVATDLDGRYDVGTTPEKAKERAGHGCDTVFPIYDIGDNATPPALAGSQVQAAGDARVQQWERACREIIDRCVAPDMYRNAREMLDRAVTEALRTLP